MSAGPSNGRSVLNYVKSQRGQKVLLHAGHQYYVQKQNKDSTRWRYVNSKIKYGCYGRMTVQGDIVLNENRHSPECVPNFEKNEVKDIIYQCEQQVCDDMSSVSQIYEKVACKKNRSVRVAKVLPDLENIKSRLYRHRNKHLKVSKTQYDIASQVVIPPDYKECLTADYSDDEDRILIFSSRQTRKCIYRVKHFFLDGTFKCCPSPFKQLYVISGDLGSSERHTNIVPLLYCLLISKNMKTYEIMFELIRTVFPKMKPNKMTFDYEVAAIKAAEKVFPRATIKGCFVHYTRCLLRKAQSLYLTNHDESVNHIKKCVALALLPQPAIAEGFILIMEDSYDDPNYTKFNDYMVQQWLENGPPNEAREWMAKWCCYGERHRTTNSVEGWNGRLNRRVGKRPTLIKYLSVVKHDTRWFAFKMIKFFKCNIPISKKKEKYVKSHAEINQIVANYENGSINLKSCIEQLSAIIAIFVSWTTTK